ncbi:MAG: PIG-L deacetylase family protein [Candidatus Helarchaeota archaeon]
MIFKPEKEGCIFILSPHIDDGELGCGGTISKLISERNTIHFFVFSLAKKSILPKFPKDITEKELYQSMQTLKIPRDNLHLFDFDVRTFPSIRQEILEILWKFNKDFSPDMVFAPSLNDLHQDHEVVAKETLRAFKNTTIFCYEEPWNSITFNLTALIRLEKSNIENKIAALRCYNSQMHRPYFQEDFIWNLAKARGHLINQNYAEAFEVMRLII